MQEQWMRACWNFNFLHTIRENCIFVRKEQGEFISNPGSGHFREYRKMMEIKTRKNIILVGDKVLLAPDKESERTAHGLYLPPGVKEKDKVQSGYVVRVGPGYAVPNPQFIDQESWSTTHKDPVKYMPLQAEEGDYAIFLRDAAIEVEYENEKYLIVSHSSILILLRSGGIDELIRSTEQS